MLRGTVGSPALSGNIKVATLVNDAKAIVNLFVQNDALNTVFDGIANMYGETVARDIFSAIPEFLVDEVISAVETVLLSIEGLEVYADKISAVAKLATDMLTGTLATVNLDGSVLVATLIDDANTISDVFFRESETINVFCEELKELYGDAPAREIFSAIPEFDINEIHIFYYKLLIS
jgi:hypothetical protein